ncbi:MAG: hypothetical protein UU25_C0031G0007 [Microgenomates group bacterium GW2011_GWB1_40_9]|nr:MAG: hypothetical protein UT26_C0047G0005 [Microgenomates group bacterium GW2011_GWC1_39_12]KKR78785.1 MAG: hypothetical protein UU25_C0031G0007 [Microgenomates group bacterium GW2011_GWB1_40_9]
MENKIILASLAMDLKRVALGLHRKSANMADRFLTEAIKRRDEVNIDDVAPYMKTILGHIDSIHNAEDALMYSTRIQNYILYK